MGITTRWKSPKNNIAEVHTELKEQKKNNCGKTYILLFKKKSYQTLHSKTNK